MYSGAHRIIEGTLKRMMVGLVLLISLLGLREGFQAYQRHINSPEYKEMLRTKEEENTYERKLRGFELRGDRALKKALDWRFYGDVDRWKEKISEARKEYEGLLYFSNGKLTFQSHKLKCENMIIRRRAKGNLEFLAGWEKDDDW